jgi:transcriptional regulator with XRE-family HTH domain
VTVVTATPAERIEAHELVNMLVARRKELGLRQGDVARRMHISQAGVSLFETGNKEPRLSTFLRYAHAVGATVAVGELDDDEG